MAHVTGVGGIFFKARDPKALAAWYDKHLGIKADEHGVFTFKWRDGQTASNPGSTVWAVFKSDTNYFGPGAKDFMINYRVDDLDGLLARLRQEGVEVDPQPENSEYGRFGWITDPEGNRIELWQPPEGM